MMKQQTLKYLFLMWFGGSFYVTLEVFMRERSHWSMFVLAGLVFIIVGLLNEIWSWNFGLVYQVLIGTAIATLGEFITGCIVNLWLGWNVWDYSGQWGNVLGQICPLFTIIWMPVILVAIVLDDLIRFIAFDEEFPRYYILKKEVKLSWLEKI